MRRDHRRRRGAQHREDRARLDSRGLRLRRGRHLGDPGRALAGARKIIAVDQFENKLAMAKRFGATHTVDASAGPMPVEAIQRNDRRRGVDYSFEAVG